MRSRAETAPRLAASYPEDDPRRGRGVRCDPAHRDRYSGRPADWYGYHAGADETVAPKEIAEGALAIGAGRKYEASFTVQVIGITKKRLDTAPNDPKIISLVLLPFVACLVGFGLAKGKSISSSKDTQDLAATAIAAGGFLLVPALLAQQVVFERESKLRDILAVMGLDFRAHFFPRG